MINRDNVIMQLDNLQRFLRNYDIEFFSNALDKGTYADRLADAITLLKEQDKRYAMMVVDWLREMAYNNYLDLSHMTFFDAILDIRERAQTGLENYFRDYDSETKQQEGW